jgi:N-acetyl-anhydromuramyl-L-alanine amidase AmpD
MTYRDRIATWIATNRDIVSHHDISASSPPPNCLQIRRLRGLATVSRHPTRQDRDNGSWRVDLGYHFDWQDGYAAFSVSESQIATVRRYIQTQEQHHARRTFHDELVSLLRKHRVELDEKDLLD